jgi:predicted metal-dependent enzyme (double-stranded beta helix superfamily)
MESQIIVTGAISSGARFGKQSQDRERAALAQFAAHINQLGELRTATVRERLTLLAAIRSVASAIDLAACIAPRVGYGRRVLVDDPSGWTLAAIALRDGQETEAHDHDGWGCVVTVQGIERDRRYRMADNGELTLISERDYLPDTGYVFDHTDIHQPSGADPRRTTVALHFLASGHTHDQVLVETITE